MIVAPEWPGAGGPGFGGWISGGSPSTQYLFRPPYLHLLRHNLTDT